ncbi:OTU domain-containing protein [Criblamydia sequanensis]|uniref:Membrane protein n=1 Tax=Candidatus Criblamydia sequanensis CRIB-18 TaxID=1437425 RepID=A0A090CYS5_9BACT|nr:OTU domain-containing protein [Criblamydia sequanensis]CDR33842.1 putative membrane protein [Criblamydia sequanensis CRIB-18]
MIHSNNQQRFQYLPFEHPNEFFNRNPGWRHAFYMAARAFDAYENPENRNNLGWEVMRVKEQNPGDSAGLVISKTVNGQLNFIQEEKQSLIVRIIRVFGVFLLNLATLGLFSLISHLINQRKIEAVSKELAFNQEFNNENVSRSLRTNASFEKMERSIQKLSQLSPMDLTESSRFTLPFEEQKAHESWMRRENLLLSEFIQDAENKRQLQLEREKEKTKSSVSNEGWVEGLYRKRDTDPTDIPGKFQDSFKSKKSIYSGKWVNDKKDMDSLLASTFDHALKTLLELAKRTGIHFNKSRKLLSETVISGDIELRKHQDSLNAVHAFMAFLLVNQAGMDRDCRNNLRLLLNDYGLSVRPSLAFRTKNPDLSKNPEGPKEIILFKNNDDWTPRKETLVPFGVDPFGAKWCLERLKKHHHHLIHLLLEPLLSDDNPILQEAKALKASNSELGVLLKTAESLLSDIGAIFLENYGAMILKKWDEFATDDRALPFCKNEKSVEEQEIDELNSITSFEPLKNPLFFNMKDSPLFQILENTRKLIEPIWTNLPNVLQKKFNDSKGLIELGKVNGGLDDIKDQYYCMHLNINNERCLFSALAVCLLQGARSKMNLDPKLLKQAIAAYLMSGGNKSPRIQALIIAEVKNYRLNSIKEYVDALLTDRINPALFGTLELELIANALAIHIEVFRTGAPYSIIGGRKTSSIHYGPKNAETRIVLFCKPNNTFYALFPMVKKPIGMVRTPEQAALQFANLYWGANNNIEYNQWSSFSYPRQSNLF